MKWRMLARCVFLATLTAAACAHAPVSPPASKTPTAAAGSATSEPLEAPSGTIFVGCGFLSVENHGATHFTVLLRAEHGKQIPKPGTAAFLLDDAIIEVASTTAGGIGAPDLRGLALLRKHMDWEASYLNTLPAWRGTRPDAIKASVDVPFPTLPWLAKPTGDTELLGQKLVAVLYVSAAINDVVYVLSAPLARPGDLDAGGLAIDKALKTLRQIPEATDLLALSTALKESNAPWPGCQRAN